jgi:hypothetical protein
MPEVLSDLSTSDFSIATQAKPDCGFAAPERVANYPVTWSGFVDRRGQSEEISPRTWPARSLVNLSASWRNSGLKTGHLPSFTVDVWTIGRAPGFSGIVMLHPSPAMMTSPPRDRGHYRIFSVPWFRLASRSLVQIPSHQDFCQLVIQVASNFSVLGGSTV